AVARGVVVRPRAQGSAPRRDADRTQGRRDRQRRRQRQRDPGQSAPGDDLPAHPPGDQPPPYRSPAGDRRPRPALVRDTRPSPEQSVLSQLAQAEPQLELVRRVLPFGSWRRRERLTPGGALTA